MNPVHNSNILKKPNRLIREKSPYLLQHAYNPVDWHPWGEEAFGKARKEDKPIFLSIGYSTCHWCHVMEQESFEDQETAGMLNDVFICIKVDREERPDLDKLYMTVCQILTGSGGWPLTIFMTPEKRPFLAGTYFPRESRFGRIGLYELSLRIKDMWAKQRDQLTTSADKIAEALQQQPAVPAGEEPGEDVLKSAYQHFAAIYDDKLGGFGGAPKFPSPHNLSFLLRYWKRYKDEKALSMVEKTLQAMRQGGIYDHIGFGFHRYSTDAEWLVPHFEKMLYDQALLAMAYIETFQATGKEEYRKTAREIFTYVLRDMTAPGGGFYSAEDADSEGEEGKFYVWDKESIQHILNTEAELFSKVFNVSENGNFTEPGATEWTGRNIPHLKKSLDELSAELEIPVQHLRERLEKARQKLFAAREKRVHPGKDDKILADWNGLMISALAKGSQAFDEPAYAEAARHAADFILNSMRRPDGSLFHRHRDGESAISGFLDDYAFQVWGLLDLYEATFETSYLKNALELTDYMTRHFPDERNGGFYLTPDTDETLIVRQKDAYDSAMPSGNSVAMLDLLRLARMTASSDMEKKAAGTGRAFFESVKQLPSAHSQLLIAVDFGLGPSYEVVIAGNPQAEDTRLMLKALRRKFAPNKVVLLRPAGQESPDIVRFALFTKDLSGSDGKATAYVCRNYACQLPTTDVDKMLELLGNR